VTGKESDSLSPGEFGRALHEFLRVSLELAPVEEPEVARRLREHLGAERLDELPILRRELQRSDHPNLQVALDRLLAGGTWSVEVLGLRSEGVFTGTRASVLPFWRAVAAGSRAVPRSRHSST
jgi:hypothetical protein